MVSCRQPPDTGRREAPETISLRLSTRPAHPGAPQEEEGPGLAPAVPAELQLRGPDDLGAGPRWASAPPWEVESVQLLRDLHEALASGLGEEDARVHGRADADTEERHIDEVGQALLEVARDPRLAVAMEPPAARGPPHRPCEGLRPLGSGEPPPPSGSHSLDGWSLGGGGSHTTKAGPQPPGGRGRFKGKI